ncbi:hypothetical protein Acsp06_44250 [Actinomycetospora sp. NBRC 106375]|uniref:DUF7714 family protein n=1 Tax=Actinomycetospora sp. NBRC 106375 TaxID=3032207 RepID=UPI0024A245F6|nr:hypothetical protein [Actinomycetospora sp. NBRC 106375]GLZ48240.1 hypothetical protein Acsp06_44250 [Actinomycetospora sp. NBRC 106375]
MIPGGVANLRSHPYRGLSVQEVDVPLTTAAITEHLLGREVYRRTEFLALRHGGATALAEVRHDTGPLFAPVTEVRVHSGPDDTAWVEAPDVDVGNATALAGAAVPGALTTVVLGRFEHVNFIHRPAHVPVRVTEVVPPEPPKLLDQARQAVAFDEDLPPVELVLDAIRVEDLVAAHPAPHYLLPCRGSGADLGGADVAYLDTRPADRGDWLMIGCERSLQFHEHFYGDDPPRVDLCPRQRHADVLTLTKCCLLERGLEQDDRAAVVPWGASLDEVREGLRNLLL